MNARDRLKDIPDLAAGASNLVDWARAVTETIQTFRGLRGDKLDKALTKRDVANGELGGVGLGGGLPGPPGPPGAPGTPGGDPYVPDLTPPPTPTGLTVTAGFTKLIVQCDEQTYAEGNGHNRTNVYGAKWPLDDLTAPTFSEAVRLWSFLGTIDAYATDPSTRWCIWIKWQSLDGVESASPAGGTNGVQATTGVDIPLVLEALAGQITASELALSLATPISLVTAPDTVPGSVDARIKAEEVARRNADSATLSIAQSYVGTFTYSRAAIDSSFAATESRLRADFAAADDAVVINARNYTNSYAYSLANGTALAGTVSTLSASVNSPTIGNNPTYAALQTEATARATLDGNVRSLYTVRTEISSSGRTLIGGFGLAGTAGGAQGPSIDFGVIANRFWVGAPVGSGLADTQLFTIQTTSWNDNGVTRPAGMYVDAAFIRNLSAIYATIATLVADQITASDISASKITAGSLRVGAYMQSTGFVSGPSGTGFRFDGNGNFEATGGTFRGTIFATAGLFSGTVRVGNNPAISGTTMTGSGAVINADGTFALGTSDGNITYNGTGAPKLNGFTTPTASLSTYSINFNADSAGNIIDVGPFAPVSVYVRNGALDEASTWTIAISAQSETGVASISGGMIYIGGFTQNTAWVDVTASKSGFATQGPLRLSLAKIRQPQASLTASMSPITVIGFGGGLTEGQNVNVTTSAATVSVSGGSGAYTYSWLLFSGASAGVNSPSSASTTFVRSGQVPGVSAGDVTETGVYACLVTDTSTGRSVTAYVTVQTTISNYV